MNALRSVGAVATGFVTVFVLSVLTDAVLVKTQLFPPPDPTHAYAPMLLAVVLVYCGLYTVIGGYVTARLAPTRPVAHAVVLGILGMAASTLGTMHDWKIGNHWYAIVLVAEGIPCCWAGALIWTQLIRPKATTA